MNSTIFTGILCLILPMAGFASSNSIALDKPKINIHDQASIERGANTYKTYCLNCHSLNQLSYNTLAEEANINAETQPNVDMLAMWTNALGMMPPDLSLVARTHGPDWVYTYLHSFYQDPSRPQGVNNLLLENTAMPNILLPLQGEQALIGTVRENGFMRKPHQYDLLQQATPGSLSPAEFDQTTADLVNFLVYAAEPVKASREKIGRWVLSFLLILGIFAYLLKKEIYKAVPPKE